MGAWVARFLGPSQFGIVNYVQSLVFLFSIISTLGLDEVVVKNLVSGRLAPREVLGTTFLLKFSGALVAIFLLFGTCLVLETSADITTYVLIFSSSLLLGSFNVIDLYFQSKVLSRNVSISGVISFFLINLIKVALILLNASLAWFIVVLVLDILFLTIGLVYFYTKESGESFRAWKWSKEVAIEMLKSSWPLIFSSIFIAAFMKIDQIMIKEILGDKSVGIYAAAAKISEIWYFIPLAVTSSLFPALINSMANSELYSVRLQRLFSFLIAISLLVALFVTFFGNYIILLLYGRDFIEASSILKMHIWSGVFVSIGLVNGKGLLAEGLQKYAMFNTGVGALVNIVLNLFLIPTLGGKGAAIATLASQVLSAYLCLLIFSKTRKRFFEITKSLFFLNIFKFIVRR